MNVGIIGAGMAGLACAQALAAGGLSIRLFDKGRGPGGRMSTRRMPTPRGEAVFDHGAQYITARSPAFAAQIVAWAEAGAVAPWPAAGEACWTGIPSMSAVPRHMARGLDVSLATHVRGMCRDGAGWYLVHDLGRTGGFDAMIVALPAEQAAAVLGLQNLHMARVAITTPSAPCWATLLAFAEPVPAPPVIRDRGIMAWAACNTSKPGRGGIESWTIHASAEWSRIHLEAEPAFVTATLRNAFAEAVGLPRLEPIAETSHRWRFAHSGGAGTDAIWDPASRLGVCGDWLAGGGVENAWLSGRRLADLILTGVERHHPQMRIGSASRLSL